MDMKESVSSAASSPQSEDVPMDDAVQSSGNSGDEGAASPSNQSDSPRGAPKMDANADSGGGGTRRPGGGGGATSNLAKFKASQDLRIQTANLPSTSSGKGKQRAHSVGSAAALGLGEGDDPEEGSAEDGKTPVPVPCSTGKKRRRRTAAQIDRKYPCTYPGCTKAYGSEGSLTQHQRLKHRNQSPEPGVQAAQLNNFFLPLHRTPRSLPSAAGRGAGPGGARTVTIRPAGIDGLALHGFDVAAAAAAVALVPENDTLAGDFLMAASPTSHPLGHPRQHLRARSNSMPISFSTPNTLSMHYTSAGPPPPPQPPTPPLPPASAGDATPSGAKAKPTRRSRVSGTPRGKPPLRRNKSRSKSESLQDVMEPFVLQEEIRPPMMDRSASDNSVSSGYFGAGPALTPVFMRPPYDWRFAIAHSQHSDSPVSSVEEAIDSDILSVLADYDTSDTCGSTLDLTASGSFEDATESSRASSSGGRFPEPDEEWLGQPDAHYMTLTTHLEKMSMIHDSPPGSMQAHKMATEDDPMTTVKLEFPDTMDAMAPAHRTDPGAMKPYFPAMSIDSFAVKAVEPPFVAGEDMKDGLKLHVSGLNDPSAMLLGRDFFETASSTAFKQEPAPPAPAAAPQPSWSKELAALETYSTSGIDHADYMEVDTSSYGPLQWKTIEKLRPATSQALFGGPLDSLTAYLQHGEKHGTYTSLSDAFALDTVDYAMEEPRLSSPVVCQPKDL